MNECYNCTKRYLGCHDFCEEHLASVEKKRKANERARELNSSVGWDGYHKHNDRYQKHHDSRRYKFG